MRYIKNKIPIIFCFILSIFFVYSGFDSLKEIKTNNELYKSEKITYDKTNIKKSLFKDDAFYTNAKISMSDTHTLILRTDDNNISHLFVQGENTCGQLGTSDYLYYDTITELTHFIPENIVEIWALNNASFLLTSNGDLYGCGNNINYKLGFDGEDKINLFTKIEIPEELKGHIIDIYGNGNHTIIKADNNKIFGCGDNQFGQLSLKENIKFSKTFIELESLSNFACEIGAGIDYTVCISKDSFIGFCGKNDKLQSGRKDFPENVYELKVVTKLYSEEELKEISKLGLQNKNTNNKFKLFVGDYHYGIGEIFLATDTFINKYELKGLKNNDEIIPFVKYFMDLSETIFKNNSFNIYENKNISDKNLICFIVSNPFKNSKEYYLDLNSKIMENGIIFYSKNTENTHSIIAYLGEKNENYKWLNTNNQNTSIYFIDKNPVIINDIKCSPNRLLLFVKNQEEKYGFINIGETFKNNKREKNDVCYLNNQNFWKMSLSEDFFKNINTPPYIDYIKFEKDSYILSKGETINLKYNEIGKKKLKIISDDYTIVSPSDQTISSINLNAKEIGETLIHISDLNNIDMYGNAEILYSIRIKVVEKKEHTNLSFYSQNYSVKKGEFLYLNVLGLSEDINYKIESENNNIVSIEDSTTLLIKANNYGNTNISLYINDELIDKTTVSVIEENSEKIIEASDITIKIGENKKIEAKIYPEGTQSKIYYEIKDTNICEIDNTTGIVVGKNKGTTQVILSVPNAKSRIINVEVN